MQLVWITVSKDINKKVVKSLPMASNRVIILAFIFFCAVCILPLGEGSSIKISEASDSTPYNFFNHYAGYYVNSGLWHGVRAKMGIWQIPDVKPKSSSSAFISAGNYDEDRSEMIAAGVHVYPSLYKNSDLRFFTYWTTNNGKSIGCFNDRCPGFVVANGSNLFPGQAITPLSSYNGEDIYITIRIKKDEKTGDWSLYREDLGGPIGGTTLLGWWPKTLFSGLSDYASQVEWTGAVYQSSDEPSPSMGSGHFSKEGDKKAAYFKDVLTFDSAGIRFRPQPKDVSSKMDKQRCYDVSDWFGNFFYYGGPSGCSNVGS